MLIAQEKSTTTEAAKKVFRADIQGLRALAVVAVVADHLFHWPTGGFIGVDVFFVISGFLITGLLLREYDRSGSISFIGFYRRRVRRIVPAATVTLVVTTLVGFGVFNAGRATQTLWDAIWSFLFVGNWHYALVGTDYFTSGGPVSPLQHFWSLSVEEQFYVVWPWLMLLIFVLGARVTGWSSKSARWAVGIAMCVIVLISFVWSVWETSTSPTWSYFSTFSRAWELGVGALLAVASPLLASIPSWIRPVLAWTGLLAICASLFFINSGMPFPGPWAVAPVLATALLIGASTGGVHRSLWPLTNRVSGYLGDISYSLYLWHFPVIVLLASILPDQSLNYFLIALVTMTILAIASYHFVEQGVLRSAWLSGGKPAERRDSRRRPRSRRSRGGASGGTSAPALVGAAVVAVGTVILAGAALAPRVPEATEAATPPLAPAIADAEPAVVAAVGAAEASVADQIRLALQADSWPEFNPPVDGSVPLRVPQWEQDRCLSIEESDLDRCVYGAPDAQHTAVLLGDSVATSWLPGLISGLEPLGYEVVPLTLEKCPFGEVTVTSSENASGPIYARCDEHRRWALQKVSELAPDLIVISDSAFGVGRLVSQASGPEAEGELEAGFEAALDQLPPETPTTILMAPPGAKNMMECYTPVSAPSSCTGELRTDWLTTFDAESAAAERMGVPFIDTREWFCSRGKCPSFVGTTAMYADASHLSATYSESLGPVLVDAFRSKGVIE